MAHCRYLKGFGFVLRINPKPFILLGGMKHFLIYRVVRLYYLIRKV